jgi:DNA-binding NarL/FixJ family response regulator
VVSGEAGIGKSTLWDAGVETARAKGFEILCARASEAEVQISFAGLADLLEAVDSALLVGLPAPQRRALEVATSRADSVGAPPDALTISAGLLGVLRLLSGRTRLLVAIDDLPRLDRASASALTFAARRLGRSDVRFLVSRRGGRSTELERALEPERLDRVELGPLSFGAISRLLADRLERPLPRRVVRQVFQSARGNPLFALELGRALLERGLPEVGAALPVPEVLDELFGARIAALAPEMRRALLAVALSAGVREEELGRVVDALVIEDAQAAGMLIVEGSRVRASHPLLAAAARAHSSARDRRDLHLALARAVSDPVLCARHRALAANGPDPELAGELATAADRSAARGALEDAAELAGHALRLTPSADEDYDERLLALARYVRNSGEHARATALLTERIDAMAPGPTRAAAHLLLGELAKISLEDEHVALALADGASDPGLRARALAKQVEILVVGHVRRIVEAEELACESLAAARSADPEAECRALVALAWPRIMRGEAIDDLAERAAQLEPVTLSLHESSLERLTGVRLAFRGELALAREVFRRLSEKADERGDFHSWLALIVQSCEVELRAGRSSEVARFLEEWDEGTASELAEVSGLRVRIDAALAALRGEPGAAAALAAELLEGDEENAQDWDRLEALRVIGVAALLERRAEDAIGSLGMVWEHTRREGVEDPGAFPVAGDLVEALAESGQLERANEVNARLGELSAGQEHPWGLATTKRSAAVVALAGGWDESAAAALSEAAAAYRELGLDFESARTLLFLGRVARRSRKRAVARRSLERARSAFEQLGCSGWAEAAEGELSRVSGRRAAAGGGLTASEQRVAELVAGGLSNKEVAAQLFVSVHTVEQHLSKVYAKLGVRSRTQLAQRLGAAS